MGWGVGYVGGGREGENRGQFFRWESSSDLKQSRMATSTSSRGNPFQTGIALGKNDIHLYGNCFLQKETSLLQLFFFFELNLLLDSFENSAAGIC